MNESGAVNLPPSGDLVKGIDFEKYELVNERGVVFHTCGHQVLWELLPGVADDWLKAAANFPCPCCGGETGVVPQNLEWPDHALYAGIGVAHCHEMVMKCKDVHRAHELGRLLKARRN